VLSILLVVLVSGAVLWVVDGERDKPTSEAADAPSGHGIAVVDPAACASDGGQGVEVALATVRGVPATPARRRQPATSRRVPRGPSEPLPEPEWRTPAPLVVPSPVTPLPQQPAVRTLDPPLPRHRLRSAILLIALLVAVGALLAAVIGVVVSALAFGLRAAVTS